MEDEASAALVAGRGGASRRRRQSAALLAVLALLIILLIVVVLSAVTLTRSQPRFVTQRFLGAAVASDSSVCSAHGKQLLALGGSAVDAAVATLLCLGVVHPHSSGLGGGAIALVRTARGEFEAVDGRETAPALAHAHMFNNSSSEKGGLSVAVPGELAAMRALHAAHGQLAWEQLFEQSAQLCEQGFVVDKSLAAAIKETFTNSSTRLGALLFGKKEGDVVLRPDLAQTLRLLARSPSDFYNGTLASTLASEVRAQGGVLQDADMANYTARSLPVVSTFFRGRKVVSPFGSFGGAMLMQFLNTVDGLIDETMIGTAQYFHYYAEAFKFAFANRLLLGDPAFEPQVAGLEAQMISPAHAALLRAKISPSRTFPTSYYADLGNISAPSRSAGTTHVSVVDSNGLAIAITSTVNLFFGSGILTTPGIIMNDEMDDFSSADRSNAFGFPPSKANFIAPGKRPLSTMTPTIVESPTGQLEVVVGGSGGSRIVTGVAQALLQRLVGGASVGESVGSARAHEQLLPVGINLESRIAPSVGARLRALGHTVVMRGADYADAVVQMIARQSDGSLEAACDWRKQGSPDVECKTAGI